MEGDIRMTNTKLEQIKQHIVDKEKQFVKQYHQTDKVSLDSNTELKLDESFKLAFPNITKELSK